MEPTSPPLIKFNTRTYRASGPFGSLPPARRELFPSKGNVPSRFRAFRTSFRFSSLRTYKPMPALLELSCKAGNFT
ncbi:MAG: hypothetical protein ACTS4V_01790 [Candidatus Hodgkinia cicadicola]